MVYGVGNAEDDSYQRKMNRNLTILLILVCDLKSYPINFGGQSRSLGVPNSRDFLEEHVELGQFCLFIIDKEAKP